MAAIMSSEIEIPPCWRLWCVQEPARSRCKVRVGDRQLRNKPSMGRVYGSSSRGSQRLLVQRTENHRDSGSAAVPAS